MIIKFASYDEKNNTMLFIPDTMPWKLTVELETISGGTEEDPDDFREDYALKLIAGDAMEEVIICSEDLWGLFSKEREEDEEIREFFNYIVEEATSDLAYALKEGKGVYDLSETVSCARKEWEFQMAREAEGSDE